MAEFIDLERELPPFGRQFMKEFLKVTGGVFGARTARQKVLGFQLPQGYIIMVEQLHDNAIKLKITEKLMIGELLAETILRSEKRIKIELGMDGKYVSTWSTVTYVAIGISTLPPSPVEFDKMYVFFFETPALARVVFSNTDDVW
jgi:hypothetical protein